MVRVVFLGLPAVNVLLTASPCRLLCSGQLGNGQSDIPAIPTLIPRAGNWAAANFKAVQAGWIDDAQQNGGAIVILGCTAPTFRNYFAHIFWSISLTSVCGLANGNVYRLGYDVRYGTYASSPTLIASGFNFVNATVGLFAFYGITASGEAYCWGSDECVCFLNTRKFDPRMRFSFEFYFTLENHNSGVVRTSKRRE